jgi:VIT1/CCC1 family predicted Fe2+/Mn2+ transporter
MRLAGYPLLSLTHATPQQDDFYQRHSFPNEHTRDYLRVSMITLQNIQTEVDASFLYAVLAEHEEDPIVADVFTQMSDIEKSHALAFLAKHFPDQTQLPPPSTRARILKQIGRVMGYNYILGVLLDTEKSISSSVAGARLRTQSKTSVSDTAHVTILRNILNQSGKVSGSNLARFEKRHRSVGGNALRAAVLGGNDGLVSNFSLVMGIAGATNGKSEVLLAGIAGLLAGALSMALGEWISVKSSQELYENQMQLEMEELETNPEGEERELALIYITKGIPEAQARQMAADVIQNKEHAHEILIKEELGINTEELKGSAMEAALASFFLFAIGAIIPVIPFFFTGGTQAIVFSTLLSAGGLFLIGSAITLFTGKSIGYSGMRQVVFGLIAAAITFGIGKIIGVSITG